MREKDGRESPEGQGGQCWHRYSDRNAAELVGAGQVKSARERTQRLNQKKRKGVVTNGAIDLVSSPVYVTDVLIITLGLATIFSYAPGPQDLKLCCPLWPSDL